MSNLSLSAETLSSTLTDFASGIYATDKTSLAEFVAPTVTTGTTDGKYYEFDRGQPFNRVPTVVDDGKSTRKVKPNGKQVSFNLDLHRLGVDVTDWSIIKAGTNAEMVTQNKVANLMSQIIIDREYELTDAIAEMENTDSVTWLGTAGSTEDIVGYLDQQIADMCTAMGGRYIPNRMVIPFPLWVQIKNHASVRERLAGIKEATDLKGFASMLANPDIEIRTGLMSYNTAARGKAEVAMKNMYGDSLLLFYNDNGISTESFGFMKTFAMDGENGLEMHTIRNATEFRDEHIGQWAQQVLPIAKHAGLLINVS